MADISKQSTNPDDERIALVRRLTGNEAKEAEMDAFVSVYLNRPDARASKPD